MNAETFLGRGEDYLKKFRIDSIVARAVGPVGRIFHWVEQCSTWNTLILLKGPGWEKEWETFLEKRGKKKLKVKRQKDYVVGTEQKKRKFVELERV